MNQFVVLAVVAGIFWGLWPIVMKASGLQGSWSVLALYVGGLCAILPVFKAQGALTYRGVALGLLAGILGGVGGILFTKITNSNSKDVFISNLYSVCLIVQLLTAVVVACFLCGEEITTKKVVGAIMACVAILLLA